MKASLKTARITPKKLNLIADMIRGKNALDALHLLKFTPKKGAKIMGKLLQSAVSNAESNFKQDKDSLYVKEIYVTKAPTLKRSVPISRGRMHPILKRNAHALVMLAVKETEKKAPAAKQKGTAEVKKEEQAVESRTAEKGTKVKKTATKKATKSTKAKA